MKHKLFVYIHQQTSLVTAMLTRETLSENQKELSC